MTHLENNFLLVSQFFKKYISIFIFPFIHLVGGSFGGKLHIHKIKIAMT